MSDSIREQRLRSPNYALRGLTYHMEERTHTTDKIRDFRLPQPEQTQRRNGTLCGPGHRHTHHGKSAFFVISDYYKMQASFAKPGGRGSVLLLQEAHQCR